MLAAGIVGRGEGPGPEVAAGLGVRQPVPMSQPSDPRQPHESSGSSEPTPQDPDTLRWVEMHQIGAFRYLATNGRGGVLPIGSGEDPDFTPVELLLAAIGGCSAIDVAHITSKRAEAESFRVRTEGHKVRDEHGNHLVGLQVTFDITFPEGDAGEQARQVLPRTLEQVRDRLCSVSRTVALGEPVAYSLADGE